MTKLTRRLHPNHVRRLHEARDRRAGYVVAPPGRVVGADQRSETVTLFGLPARIDPNIDRPIIVEPQMPADVAAVFAEWGPSHSERLARIQYERAARGAFEAITWPEPEPQRQAFPAVVVATPIAFVVLNLLAWYAT